MDTTDFIATFALITSVASLTYTWAVDRRRPRLKVRGDIVNVFDRSPVRVEQQGPYFNITATNLGPGRIRVMGVGLTHRSWLKRRYRRYIKKDNIQGVVMDALPESPNQLPIWLEVGETRNLFHLHDSEILNKHDMYDSLGGEHWAQKAVFSRLRESLAKRDPLDKTGNLSTKTPPA